MTNEAYQEGRRSEYYMMDKLKKRGYVCIRSAGSHGPIDIMAGRNGKVFAIQVKKIQVKNNKEPYIAPAKRDELAAWAAHLKARPMLAYKDENNRWCMKDIEKGFIYVNFDGI